MNDLMNVADLYILNGSTLSSTATQNRTTGSATHHLKCNDMAYYNTEQEI